MKRKSHVLFLLLLSAALSSSLANAGNGTDKGSQGAENGQPFQQLQADIDAHAEDIAANAEAIAENAGDIAQLGGELGALQDEVSALGDEVLAISDQVDANTGGIADLVDNDADLLAAIASNSDLLADLRQQHNRDVKSLQASISLISKDVSVLQRSLQEGLERVNVTIARMQRVQAGVDAAQDAQLLALQSEALSLMASVLTINGTLASHASSLVTLDGRLNSVDAQLNEMGATLLALEGRVDTLECLPGHPDDPCDGVPITVAGEGYGHHGSCSGGWNDCGDAGTCALYACEVNGYSEVVRWGEGKPCPELDTCHLFPRRGSVDWNVKVRDNCPVLGVTDIECK
jgi:septal ring factor EnvC (AmiA/AmiB activator)